MEPKYYHKLLGWNARIDTVQAALLRVKLPHLEGWIAKRQAAGARYDALIEEQKLSSLLTRPVAKLGRRHTYNQYVVRVNVGERDAMVRHLKSEGIGCEIYYPMPLHTQECLAYLGYTQGDFPVSEAACRQVLALPIFPEITADQQAMVIASCSNFLHKQKRRAA